MRGRVCLAICIGIFTYGCGGSSKPQSDPTKLLAENLKAELKRLNQPTVIKGDSTGFSLAIAAKLKGNVSRKRNALAIATASVAYTDLFNYYRARIGVLRNEAEIQNTLTSLNKAITDAFSLATDTLSDTTLSKRAAQKRLAVDSDSLCAMFLARDLPGPTNLVPPSLLDLVFPGTSFVKQTTIDAGMSLATLKVGLNRSEFLAQKALNGNALVVMDRMPTLLRQFVRGQVDANGTIPLISNVFQIASQEVSARP